MDQVCSACLCTGRNLKLIGDTTSHEFYMQILNECYLPLFDDSKVCIKICWECRSLLNNFQKFKQQIHNCYKELLDFIDQDPENIKYYLTKPSHLQIHNVIHISYPQDEIKQEVDELMPSDITVEEFKLPEIDLHVEDVKSESVHLEPETFAKNLDLKPEKIKKRKKSIQKVKVKSKKKVPKSKKKRKKSTEQSDVDDSFDNEPLIEYEGSNVNEEKLESKDEDDVPLKDLAKNEFVCEECKSVFSLKKDLLKHMQSHNVRTIPDKVKLPPKPRERIPLDQKPRCVECGKTFSSKKTYRYHLNVLHRGQNRHECPKCGKVYQWKSNLGRHMRTHKERGPGELYCARCDKHFASLATYKQHLLASRTHVTEEHYRYACNDCSKRFTSKIRLRDHIDWEHLKKVKYWCQLCNNKPFKCHTSLYVHRQNVHRDREKKDNLCHVCGKSYQNAAKLKYHIVAMHSTETPYKCSECGAAFGWYSSLYRHMREVHCKMKYPQKKTKKNKKVEEIPSVPQQMPELLPLNAPGPTFKHFTNPI